MKNMTTAPLLMFLKQATSLPSVLLELPIRSRHRLVWGHLFLGVLTRMLALKLLLLHLQFERPRIASLKTKTWLSAPPLNRLTISLQKQSLETSASTHLIPLLKFPP